MIIKSFPSMFPQSLLIMKILLPVVLLLLSTKINSASTVPDNDKSDIARLYQEIEQLKKVVIEIEELKEQLANSYKEIEDLRRHVKNVTQHRSAAGGAVYTRWGRTVCPSDGTLVYRGFMIGGYNSAGTYGGHTTSYVCLAYPPQWATYSDVPGGAADVYAVQYSCAEPNCPFSLENNGGNTLHLNLAPCAVCQAPADRLTQVVLAAMRNCPEGWNSEYNGYLMSTSGSRGAPTRTSMEMICVDDGPEIIPNSLTSFIGAHAYVAEISCGGLPCSDYPDGREVTCVVCTN